MDPLRKNKKFDEKFQDEEFKDERFKDTESKPADISKAENFKTGLPEQPQPAGRTVPMGPMPASLPTEAQEPTAGGPRLVSKEERAAAGEAKLTPLFAESQARELRARWDKIQAAFVDQPQQAVEDADNLVGEAIKSLTEQFADERSSVFRTWNSEESGSTELLRQSLRRYRSFLERLLAA